MPFNKLTDLKFKQYIVFKVTCNINNYFCLGVSRDYKEDFLNNNYYNCGIKFKKYQLQLFINIISDLRFTFIYEFKDVMESVFRELNSEKIFKNFTHNMTTDELRHGLTSCLLFLRENINGNFKYIRLIDKFFNDIGIVLFKKEILFIYDDNISAYNKKYRLLSEQVLLNPMCINNLNREVRYTTVDREKSKESSKKIKKIIANRKKNDNKKDKNGLNHEDINRFEKYVNYLNINENVPMNFIQQNVKLVVEKFYKDTKNFKNQIKIKKDQEKKLFLQGLKKCSTCKIIKPMWEFHNDRDKKHNKCKECARNLKIKTKKHRVKQEREYQKKNRKKITDKQREYKEQHIEKIKKYQKEWQKTNRDEINRKRREKRAKIKKRREYQQMYRIKNKEKFTEYNHEYYIKNTKK